MGRTLLTLWLMGGALYSLNTLMLLDVLAVFSRDGEPAVLRGSAGQTQERDVAAPPGRHDAKPGAASTQAASATLMSADPQQWGARQRWAATSSSTFDVLPPYSGDGTWPPSNGDGNWPLHVEREPRRGSPQVGVELRRERMPQSGVGAPGDAITANMLDGESRTVRVHRGTRVEEFRVQRTRPDR